MRQKMRIGPHSGALALFLLMVLVLVHCVGWTGATLAQRLGPQPPQPAPRVYYGTSWAARSGARDARGDPKRGSVRPH